MEYDENVRAMVAAAGSAPLMPRPRLVPDPLAEQRARDEEARRRRDEQQQLSAAYASLPVRPGEAFEWMRLRAELNVFPWWGQFVAQWPRIRRARRVMLWDPQSGAGKTSLALWMLHQIVGTGDSDFATEADIELARGCRFVPERDLCPPSGLAQRRNRLEEALDATVLVLDDMGATGSSSYFLDCVKHLLKERADRGATTWCTTFLEPRAWWERYDGGNERRYFVHNPDRGQYVLDLAHPEKTQ